MEITKKTRHLCAITFSLYMLLLVWIIALKCNMKDAILDAKIFNRDFTLSERFMFQFSRFSTTSLADAVLNILFFVPLGVLLPFLVNKPAYIKTVLFCFLISTGFELLQIFNCIGRFTYIDIINNTMGGVVGGLIHFVVRPKRKAKDGMLEIAFKALISVLIPTLIIITINTIIHIDYYL